MTLAQTAFAIPAVAAIVHEYTHGPLGYSAACKQIETHGFSALEAGLILGDAFAKQFAPHTTWEGIE